MGAARRSVHPPSTMNHQPSTIVRRVWRLAWSSRSLPDRTPATASGGARHGRDADDLHPLGARAVGQHRDRLAAVVDYQRAADAAPAGPGAGGDGADAACPDDPHAEVARRRAVARLPQRAIRLALVVVL